MEDLSEFILAMTQTDKERTGQTQFTFLHHESAGPSIT